MFLFSLLFLYTLTSAGKSSPLVLSFIHTSVEDASSKLSVIPGCLPGSVVLQEFRSKELAARSKEKKAIPQASLREKVEGKSFAVIKLCFLLFGLILVILFLQ
ncbi:hypothetical protein BMS3Abin04_02952 [bacterium BMS3Abin04]|nr:hypothetical protein BMS3Abin04_02952 [bacterium BMS3Abin04]